MRRINEQLAFAQILPLLAAITIVSGSVGLGEEPFSNELGSFWYRVTMRVLGALELKQCIMAFLLSILSPILNPRQPVVAQKD